MQQLFCWHFRDCVCVRLCSMFVFRQGSIKAAHTNGTPNVIRWRQSFNRRSCGAFGRVNVAVLLSHSVMLLLWLLHHLCRLLLLLG